MGRRAMIRTPTSRPRWWGSRSLRRSPSACSTTSRRSHICRAAGELVRMSRSSLSQRFVVRMAGALVADLP